MKHCAEHWTAMRGAIEARGMSHLVAGSGQEALQRQVRELEAHDEGAKPPANDFDPLMAMNWAFFNRALENAGLGLMAEKDQHAYDVEAQFGIPRNEGQYCPLCIAKIGFLQHARGKDGRCESASCSIVVVATDKPWDEVWLESCADAMLARARELGLISTQ